MSDPCTSIQAEIDHLNASKADLSDELHDAAPGARGGITAKIKALNTQIDQKKQQLATCRTTRPIPDEPHPCIITVTGIQCIRETSGLFTENDEIYFVAFCADLSSPIPRPNVFVGPVLEGMTDGVARGVSKRIYGPQESHNVAQPAPINAAHPEKFLILLALLEQDSSAIESIQAAVNALSGTLVLDTANGTDRATMVNHLTTNMIGAIMLGRQSGFLDPDDLLAVQELTLSEPLLRKLAFEGSCRSFLSFSGQGGMYNVFFEVKRV